MSDHLDLTLMQNIAEYPLIAFHGEKEHGKNTAAEPLVAAGWHQSGFADPLKAWAYEANPMIQLLGHIAPFKPVRMNLQELISLVGWENAKKHPEVRRFLQESGTGARKVFGPWFWVQRWEEGVEGIKKPKAVTDLRFDNEAERIIMHKGFVVKIVNPYRKSNDNHVSEKGIRPELIRYTLLNDGTKEELHQKVLEVVRNEGYEAWV